MSEDQVETVLGAAHALAAGRASRRARRGSQPFASADFAHHARCRGALIALAETLDQVAATTRSWRWRAPALARAAGYFSPFGLAWLRRNEVCALAGASSRSPRRRSLATRSRP